MQVFSINHITSSLHYPQSNGLAEKYVQIVKCLFNKPKEEFDDIPQYLLTGNLQSAMQILQGKSAGSDSTMSNAARTQFGIQPEVLRNIDKHEKLPTYDLHVGHHVMYQDRVSKSWHPAIITSLCHEKWSYKIKTSDSVIFRKTQAYLKPYTPQDKNVQSTQSVSQAMVQLYHMWPVVQLMAHPDHQKSLQVNNQSQVPRSRPKRDTKPSVKLHL